MTLFDRSKVAQVYSGKTGCMCGCRGNHRYASAYVKDFRPSYLDGDEGVSDRSVAIVTGKVERLLSDPKSPIDRLFWTDDYVSVEHSGDRNLTIYFAQE